MYPNQFLSKLLQLFFLFIEFLGKIFPNLLFIMRYFLMILKMENQSKRKKTTFEAVREAAVCWQSKRKSFQALLAREHSSQLCFFFFFLFFIDKKKKKRKKKKESKPTLSSSSPAS